jgi:hypothetical protein
MDVDSFLGWGGGRADFVEAAAIDESVDALAHGEPSALLLPRDLVGAAQFARHPLAPAQRLQFRLPAGVLARPDRRIGWRD